MKINRDVSFVELQKALLKEMSAVLKPEIFSYSTPINEMFKMHLQEGSADPGTYLESKFEHPLLTDMIDLALSVHPTDSGPQHIKISLQWTEPEKYFSDMNDHTVEHESVKSEEKEVTPEINQLTLEQCLDHYTKAETLSAEDAWRCPNCQKYLPVVKTLGLWSLPDILVIHFKRFRQQQLKGSQVSKLTTMVKFPLNGFDLSTWHLFDKNNCTNLGTSSVNGSLSRKFTKSSSKSATLTKTFLNNEDHKYDLYAVCYHQGETLETGHYTAACKNPYDQQWYKFDDQRVSHINQDEVPDKIVNNEAYMLFYQRRKTCENSDSSGASTSSGEHWVSKIVTAPPSTMNTLNNKTQNTTGVPSNKEIEEKLEEINKQVPTAIEPINLESKNDDIDESKKLEAILNIDDIKAIDSDDIPEVASSDGEMINQPNEKIKENNAAESTTEHSIKTDDESNKSSSSSSCTTKMDDNEEKCREENVNHMVNGNNYDTNENSVSENDNNSDDDEDEEKIIEQKIEVKVEISASSPPPEKDEEKEIVRNERDKIEDLMSQHKISNLLWNDQNNNTSNRHSDIGAIKISDLLLMDRIEDISSTSLPKNYMLHDTERITTQKDYRIRGVSSCSKDTLLYIDQQSLLDDDSLLENRSHWVSLGLLNV